MRSLTRRFDLWTILPVVGVALTLLAAPASAFDGSYRRVEAGDLAFDVPSNMRAPSVDGGGPGRVDVRAPDWTFTVTDRPDRPDQGMTITFQWSRDAADSAAGDQILSSGVENASGFSADWTSWRTRSMGWRGMDYLVRNAAPNGEPLRISCHAPESNGSTIERVCRHVAASLVLATIDEGGRETSPTTTGETPSAAPTTNDGSPPAASDDGRLFAIVAAAAVLVIAVLGLSLLVVLRRKRSEPTPPAAAPVATPTGPSAAPPAPVRATAASPAPRPAARRAAPCFCTECGTQITLIGPCPACGAVVASDDD